MSDLSIGNYSSPYGNYDTSSPYSAYRAGSAANASENIPGQLPKDDDSDEKLKPPGQKDSDEEKDKTGRSDPEDCETCKKRKYQDASDEGNVSFKNASHVSPEAAGAAVRAHEGMHMTNAYNKASEAGGEVVSAYVIIHTSVCPECGRTYVSGGTTHTQIKYPNQSNPYQQGRMAEDAASLKGAKVDYNV